MRPTDYGYDPDNEWLECPKCHSVMLTLRDYEVQTISEFPAMEGDWITFLLWGWTMFVLELSVKFISGLVTFGARKAKLAKAKAELLVSFPNSLVCPRCMNIEKRR